MTDKPLQGLLVVSLEQAVAAPFATRQLADLGARVIKIERPGGGDFARSYDPTVRGQSAYFVWLNRGKQSVTLDLKSAEDLELLKALLDRADVFVQNLAPGAAARLRLGADDLRRAYPRLIDCSISGYGPGGPYEGKKAYDLLIQCEAGLVSVTGSADHEAKAGISIADIAAGMYAYSGVLTALYDRRRTGRGSSLHVSMLDALGEWMQQPYLYDTYNPEPLRRSGARHSSIAPYGPYLAGDGETIFIGVQNDREWREFCLRILDRPDLVDDARFAGNAARVAHDQELTVVVQSVLDRFGSVQIFDMLDRVGIANARLRTPAQFGQHPQLAARDRWTTVGTPNGPVRMLKPPAAAPHAGLFGPVPALGEHNDLIRAEFGSPESSPTRHETPPAADG